MKRKKRSKKNWGKEDLQILLWVISKYLDFFLIPNINQSLVRITLILETWGLALHRLSHPGSHCSILHVQMVELTKRSRFNIHLEQDWVRPSRVDSQGTGSQHDEGPHACLESHFSRAISAEWVRREDIPECQTMPVALELLDIFREKKMDHKRGCHAIDDDQELKWQEKVGTDFCWVLKQNWKCVKK